VFMPHFYILSYSLKILKAKANTLFGINSIGVLAFIFFYPPSIALKTEVVSPPV